MKEEMFNPDEALKWYMEGKDANSIAALRKRWIANNQKKKGYQQTLGKDTVYKKSERLTTKNK